MKKIKYNFKFAIIIIFLLISNNHCFAQRSLNLDFELKDYYKYWVTSGSNLFKVSLDSLEKYKGRYSLKIELENNDKGLYNLFSCILPHDIFAGKTVELRGWVKTKDVKLGYAGLWFRVDGTDIGSLGINNMQDMGLKGSTDWTQLSIKMDVSEEANMIVCGGIFTGEGSVWYDNFELYVNGERYIDFVEPEPKLNLSQKETQALKKYIYPLRTYEPDGKDDKDLKILDKLIGKSCVVALGEVSHGSSEIYKLKNRIIQYMATNNGFDIFSLETNMPEAYKLNDNIINCKGDLKESMAWMPWVCGTEEILNMVEWMRKFNQPQQRIMFTGFDMQLYQGALNELFDAFKENKEIEKVIIELKNKLDLTSKRLKQISNSSIGLTENQIKELNSLLSSIENYIDISQFQNLRKKWLHQNITLIRQNMASKSGFDINCRDSSMFNNFIWIKEQNRDSKFIISAHNSHIMKNNMIDIQIPVYNVMGQHLANKLKSDYVNFGFTFFDGSYTSNGDKGLAHYEAIPAIEGTLEYLLNQLDEPIFILDMKRLKADKNINTKWLLECMDYRGVGALHSQAYQDGFLRQRKIADDFDYLIFIKRSSPSKPLSRTEQKIYRSSQDAVIEGYNLDFETIIHGLPAGCQLNGTKNIKFSADSLSVKSGKYSLSIECAEGTSQFGICGLIIPKKYDGKQITLSGYVKSENITDGSASIFLRVDPEIDFRDAKITGTTEWTKYEITVKMDTVRTECFSVGLMLNGRGKVWFDDLKVTIDGVDIYKLKPIQK